MHTIGRYTYLRMFKDIEKRTAIVDQAFGRLTEGSAHRRRRPSSEVLRIGDGGTGAKYPH